MPSTSRSASYTTFLKLLLVVLSVAYPVVIYFGLQTIDPRYLVLILVAMAAMRAMTLDKSPLNHWFWLPLLLILAMITWHSNNPLTLKLYPVFINLSFFLLFTWSLWNSPPIIERLARLTYKDFPDRAITYTRTVTIVWCYFFIFNGGTSLAITLFASDALWALYNGLIAYGLMGALFAIEWIIRQRVIKNN